VTEPDRDSVVVDVAKSSDEGFSDCGEIRTDSSYEADDELRADSARHNEDFNV
jgi:hypothetical protein